MLSRWSVLSVLIACGGSVPGGASVAPVASEASVVPVPSLAASAAPAAKPPLAWVRAAPACRFPAGSGEHGSDVHRVVVDGGEIQFSAQRICLWGDEIRRTTPPTEKTPEPAPGAWVEGKRPLPILPSRWAPSAVPATAEAPFAFDFDDLARMVVGIAENRQEILRPEVAGSRRAERRAVLIETLDGRTVALSTKTEKDSALVPRPARAGEDELLALEETYEAAFAARRWLTTPLPPPPFPPPKDRERPMSDPVGHRLAFRGMPLEKLLPQVTDAVRRHAFRLDALDDETIYRLLHAPEWPVAAADIIAVRRHESPFSKQNARAAIPKSTTSTAPKPALLWLHDAGDDGRVPTFAQALADALDVVVVAVPGPIMDGAGAWRWTENPFIDDRHIRKLLHELNTPGITAAPRGWLIAGQGQGAAVAIQHQMLLPELYAGAFAWYPRTTGLILLRNPGRPLAGTSLVVWAATEDDPFPHSLVATRAESGDDLQVTFAPRPRFSVNGSKEVETALLPFAAKVFAHR
jgi:predicted esterase